MTQTQFPSARLQQLAQESLERSSRLHAQFLDHRSSGLQVMTHLIAQQIQPAAPLMPSALFNAHQLAAFGAGDMVTCFGERYRKYAGLLLPRIPNGDLRMMTRIEALSGTPGDVTPGAWIRAAYEYLPQDWFVTQTAGHEMPYSLWMETALQPCGFLSAYLDSYALLPAGEFVFRNLDGRLTLLAPPPQAPATIEVHAELLGNVVGAGTLIQRYGIEMSANGQKFCSGESTFGYFPVETMRAQTGLDNGRRTEPAALVGGFIHLNAAMQASSTAPQYRLSGGRFHLIDTAQVEPHGGRFGQGRVVAQRALDPQAWFFPFHFSGDPVMPGSLGVEAALEALQAAAIHLHYEEGIVNPRFRAMAFDELHPRTTIWRYRGQILPTHRQMTIELHLKAPQRISQGVRCTADASLWCDGLRIYEMTDLALEISSAA